ncbi:MAG TPA: pyridoxal-phosphate dependent enzyme [Gemmatimonadaceae bacterium]|jgi:1-aminocyclopropane-1-carboxylate deaminase/D-cysteine desulfhydrase-like pyridoxal-dependent ACC family enzyme
MGVENDEDVTATHSLGDDIPLYRRFPALRSLPRASLCMTPSPLQRIAGIPGADDLWIKRDDLNAPLMGGNKVRALEFLLGRVRAGDTVLTLGGAGSTHVLATSIHARRLGAGTMAIRWRHDMNEVSEVVAERLGNELGETTVRRTPAGAMLRCSYLRLTRNVYFIPVGGSTPLGALGHVNAGLELAAQIAAGEMQLPRRIVLPLATGGTMAGLSLGLAIAKLDIPVVGARVGPRLYANRRTLKSIIRGTARAITEATGESVPGVRTENLRIVHNVYGGAYGRPLAAGTEAAAMLREVAGIRLDSTYSAKAFVAALEAARAEPGGGPTLFWLTFDGRWLTS